MKKRTAVIGICILAASMALTGCSAIETARGAFEDTFSSIVRRVTGGGSSSKDTIAVQSVSMLAGLGNVGLQDRYSGVVVSQAIQEVNRDDDRKVKELKVKVGDTVKKGDILFLYDTEDTQLSIDQGKLELEKLKNTIASTKKQIEQLTKARKKTKEGSSEQLSYSIEIQTLEADNKENEYNLQVKEAALKRLEDSIGKNEVYSPIDGIVQKINEEGGSSDDEDDMGFSGSSSAYIVLMEVGNYRVKGTINEMNRNALLNTEGSSIIIRSRVDRSVIWYGTLEKIDTENPISNQSDYGYDDGENDEMSRSTNYPFYIALDSSDGLMMGQHVYIELNQGQEEQKSGLWLPSYFLGEESGGGYIMWAASDRDKLEKRTVVVGDYNEELDEYEILEGITADDYVAIYDIALSEGLPVTRYDEEYFDDSLDDEDFDDMEDDEDFDDEDGLFSDEDEDMDFSDEDFSGEFEEMDFSDDADLMGDEEDESWGDDFTDEESLGLDEGAVEGDWKDEDALIDDLDGAEEIDGEDEETWKDVLETEAAAG